jgi:3-phenylpropionate/trans-cinnamate dioxygenase ferredoxin subunit
MLDELAPGTMLRFDLDDTPLVVCRSEDSGEVYAIDARCPHQGALLCKGTLTGLKLRSSASSEILIRRGEIIQCPVHRWDFDVCTGYSIGVWPRHRAQPYPVKIAEGKIYVTRP